MSSANILIIHEHRFGATTYFLQTKYSASVVTMMVNREPEEFAKAVGIDYEPDRTEEALSVFDLAEEEVIQPDLDALWVKAKP